MEPIHDPATALADWLEDLGLAEHLAAAGLPTYVRDDRGRARWHDPRTGEPLSTDQLSELDRLLHDQGSEPAHAVPIALVQLRRDAAVRRSLLAEDRHDYASLARLRGATTQATRFAVHRAATDHLLLVVPASRPGEEVVVPGFQLDDHGAVRTELIPVITPLLASGLNPWRVWAWLARPAGLLAGLVPQRAAADPQTHDLVVRAAVRLGAQVVAGGR